MHKIACPNQSGFISGQQLYGNLHHLFNIIYSPAASNAAEVLITLHAHKAFDMINMNIYLKY